MRRWTDISIHRRSHRWNLKAVYVDDNQSIQAGKLLIELDSA